MIGFICIKYWDINSTGRVYMSSVRFFDSPSSHAYFNVENTRVKTTLFLLVMVMWQSRRIPVSCQLTNSFSSNFGLETAFFVNHSSKRRLPRDCSGLKKLRPWDQTWQFPPRVFEQVNDFIWEEARNVISFAS